MLLAGKILKSQLDFSKIDNGEFLAWKVVGSVRNSADLLFHPTHNSLMGPHRDITQPAAAAHHHKKDSDKLQELQDKYKRPKNVQNLQVPKINDVIWRQLRRETRIHDFSLQQSHKNYALSLIPILRGLEALKKEKSAATEHIMDAYKILCLNIKLNNATRADKIKPEISPKYRSLCESSASTEQLFGDDLQDMIKKLEGPKTHLTTNTHSFLYKKGSRANQNQRTTYRTQHQKSVPQQQKQPLQHKFKQQRYHNKRRPYQNKM